MLHFFYTRLVLPHPRAVLAVLALALVFLAFQARQLQVDASAETLLLEDDEDLRIAREINKRYASPDFLFIAYTPRGDLLSDETLDELRRLKGELAAVKGVESVISILDVPLLESPPKPVKELLRDVPTLESPHIDRALAKQEFLNSPIYRDLLVSPDFRTTAMQVNLTDDEAWRNFVQRRYDLREKQRGAAGLTPEEAAELARIQVDFKAHRERVRAEQHETIKDVRAVLVKYKEESDVFLGGANMIADDIISFVKNDLWVFGLGVAIFLVVALWTIFRAKRWVIVPLLTCLLSVVATSGFLGMFDWEVTVISSNFVSLQLIMTMAITIHLIVRYREELAKDEGADQLTLVGRTVLAMAQPCFFMAITTAAGFSSLLLSGILPVINFGWMMSAGLGVSLVLTFLLFPTILAGLPKIPSYTAFEDRFSPTRVMAFITEKSGRAILVVSGLLFLWCVAGAAQLKVENSFIDYFKQSTEIYQGMKVIDQRLGGTTPMDVVLNFGGADASEPEPAPATAAAPADAPGEGGDGGLNFDEFEKEFKAEEGKAQYWFTAAKMAEVSKVHDYLESVPENGKVLSLGTMIKVGESLNDGKPMDNFTLALIYNELPERFRKIILDPYVSVEDNQVRYAVRIRDSEPSLRRNELLQRINHDLEHDLQLDPERFQVAGLMVLYNNMLQSLFDSQILTLGAVIAALMVMFLVLFRSLRIALVAILPNILSVGVVLGLMGWAGIPLDLMTITIAAISVGIAVDDTIHYIHRFQAEFPKDRDYMATMHRCHNTIGYAMYYTSVTIIAGFSILVLSNFIPTIYFGLLTGLAMLVAWVAALTLLPQLIITLKPFGAEA